MFWPINRTVESEPIKLMKLYVAGIGVWIDSDRTILGGILDASEEAGSTCCRHGTSEDWRLEGLYL